MKNLNLNVKPTLWQFVQYCKAMSNNADKLNETYEFLKEEQIKDKEWTILCLAFQNITGNGIPNEEVVFAEDYFYFDDMAESESDVFTYLNHENKHLIRYVIATIGMSTVEIINDENKCKIFLNYLLAYFYFTVFKLLEEDDEEMLASFIYSINSFSIDELSEGKGEFIWDEIIDCLKYVFGIDTEDYYEEDGKFTVTHYDGFTGAETSYDYHAIAREIIDSLI